MSSATPSTGSPRQLGARAWKGVEPPQVARSNGCGGARGEPQTVAQRSRQRQATTYVYEFGWPCPQFGGRLRAGHALEIGFVRPVHPSTAVDPQRVVSLIGVVGCGTAPTNGIRQTVAR